MSPEQCRGLPVTAASDQYSLGVMLYELLTGRAPFSGTLYELLKAHVSDAPPPILAVKPEVDPALEAIIMSMLAKNETERFPSLHDVSKALASLGPRRSQAERQAIIAAVAAHAPGAAVVTPFAGTIMPPLAYDTADLSRPADAVAGRAVADRRWRVTAAESSAQRPWSRQASRRRSRRDGASRGGRIRDCVADRVAKTAPRPAPPARAAKVDSVAPTKPADSIPAAKAERPSRCARTALGRPN